MKRYDEEETDSAPGAAAVIGGTHLPRLTSKAGKAFPFDITSAEGLRVCYFEVDESGVVTWLREPTEVVDALDRAVKQQTTVFAAWPGQWRTHLFIVDNPVEARARMLKGVGSPASVSAARGRVKLRKAKPALGVSATVGWTDEVSDWDVRPLKPAPDDYNEEWEEPEVPEPREAIEGEVT